MTPHGGFQSDDCEMSGNEVQDLEDDLAETTQGPCEEAHVRRRSRQVVPLLALGFLVAVAASWRRVSQRQSSPPRDSAVRGPAVEDDGRRRRVRRVPAAFRRRLKYTRPTPDAFCFTLVGQQEQELPLLRSQVLVNGGVFGCRDWGVFCNPVVKPCTSRFKLKDTDVRKGGRWHTALNTGLFKALWGQVLNDGVWRKHAWTVKVDTDSVFLPWRLINHVSGSFERSQALFFLNCQYGLHGPIEILSKAALQAIGNPKKGLGMTSAKCKAPQEDVFLEKCLLANGATEIPDYKILDEKACHRDRSYKVDCASPHVVAFHPFKGAEAWKQCWNTALRTEIPGKVKAKVTGYGNGRRRHNGGKNGWAP